MTFQCDKCKKEFDTKKEAVEHEKGCKGKKNVCAKCGKELKWYECVPLGLVKSYCKDCSKISSFSNRNKIVTEEERMASIGYHKGKMCPFTQVKVGGTTNISSAVLLGTPTTDEYTWTHGVCLGEYCAIWGKKKKQCSIKTIAEKS